MSVKINVICRKDRTNKDNTAPIFIRFTHNRKTRYVSTGLTIDIDLWDFDKQRVKESHPDQSQLKYKIDTKLYEYDKKTRRLEALDIEVNLNTLLETNNRKVNCTLADCFKREISRFEALGKYASVSKHKVVLSLINQFRTANIRLEEIDLTYLNDFELFLRRRGNKDNSIATKFSVLKSIYNKAIAEEIIQPKTHPFKKFKVGKLWTSTKKRAIDKSELQKIIDFTIPENYLSPYLEFARDIFLFTYFSAGINFRDIAILRYSNICNGRINYIRNKTGKDISCKLMPHAERIISKYSKYDYCDEDYIFPILDRKIHKTEMQKYNRIHKVLAKVNNQLNVLGEQVGIKTHLTTYVARHTFATVLKRSGVNIAIISESLGHSDLATTQIYLDSFENSQIDEAMAHLL